MTPAPCWRSAVIPTKLLEHAGVDHMVETCRALDGFPVPDYPTYGGKAATSHWRALAHLFNARLSSRLPSPGPVTASYVGTAGFCA
jgi:hypothetical protein